MRIGRTVFRLSEGFFQLLVSHNSNLFGIARLAFGILEGTAHRFQSVFEHLIAPIFQQCDRSQSTFHVDVHYLSHPDINAHSSLTFISVAYWKVLMVGSIGNQKQVQLELGNLDLRCYSLIDRYEHKLLPQFVFCQFDRT